ncbi:RagB/SusD family nutrient uptake outer membrane protein [Chitinophaga sp. NPDC101104]|uniref:RagB/SusD family nutrient uptake outer membrane protein n=1 Tax=Chitinophaga sp. NPDC101104 TaxID=3390561 RepID=UPI003D01C111
MIHPIKRFHKTYRLKTWLLLALLSAVSCSKLIEIDPPINSISTEQVFQNDAKANAALAALYGEMINTTTENTFVFGGLTLIGGLMADECFPSAGTVDLVNGPFYLNKVLPRNDRLSAIWNEGYRYIYIANSLIEGVEGSASPHLSDTTRRQVVGEAKFVRAWTHFNLANLFGPVPLVLTTDVTKTRYLSRAGMPEVYAQLEADLKDAWDLLQPDYHFGGGARIRPNRFAAAALLARVYLYQGRWAEAEAEAAKVIGNAAYVLEPLAKTFRETSRETIWSLKRNAAGQNIDYLMDAFNFSPKYRFSVMPPDAHMLWYDKDMFEMISVDLGMIIPIFQMSPELTGAFEPNDRRKTVWMDSIPWPEAAPYNGKTTYFSAKYNSSLTLVEPADLGQCMVRLAEVYLIRAEARAQQGTNLAGAAADLDAIRERAGLERTTASTKPALLDAILRERRVELFAEWGHRWFDLKRAGKAAEMAALYPDKQPWSDSKLLLPIPAAELEIAPSLYQNPGY